MSFFHSNIDLNQSMKISFFTAAFIATAAIALTTTAYAEDDNAFIPFVKAPNPMIRQPWETRRVQFAKIIQGVRAGDAQARKEFDNVLTEFDTKPLVRTPMENMEIVGVYYLPREGVEKVLPIVVLNAMLGWYDALRFASESGRAEISQSLFKMAFTVTGPDAGSKAARFFDEQPDRTQQIVEQGIGMANSHRRAPPLYDQHWPTAFGLERSICAQGGICEVVKPLPESQWDAAWEQARQRVLAYYRGSKPVARTPSSQSLAK
jgi:hypothetical protein